MKLIKPSFEIIEQPEGPSGINKMIEIAGRTCYKSEDKMTEDSASDFVQRMIKSGHWAMLEHGTVYLSVPYEAAIDCLGLDWVEETYCDNPYSHVNGDGECNYITTNLRVIYENNWLKDMRYLCEPTELHEKRVTVRFVCDRGVSHEFVRHRVFSFAQESTRYCNYSKDKFNNEVTFIQPCWGMTRTGNYQGVDNFDGDWFEHSLRDSEKYYFKLIELGWKPQQARAVLPNALKTELVMTGTTKQWEGFFRLRDDEKHTHPQAYELAHPLHEEFKKRGLCAS